MKKIFHIVLINLISLNYSFAESTFLDCEFKNGKTLRNLTEVVMVFSKGDKINGELLIDSLKVFYKDSEKTIIDNQFDYKLRYKCKKINKLL